MLRRPPSSTLFSYTTLFRSLTLRSPQNQDWTATYPLRHGDAAQGTLSTLSGIGHGRFLPIKKTFGKPKVQKHPPISRSEEHTSELQSQSNLVCRLLLEKKTQ